MRYSDKIKCSLSLSKSILGRRVVRAGEEKHIFNTQIPGGVSRVPKRAEDAVGIWKEGA